MNIETDLPADAEQELIAAASSEAETAKPPPDPAFLAASALLGEALDRMGLAVERLRAPGTIAIVRGQTSEWSLPLRNALLELLGERARDGSRRWIARQVGAKVFVHGAEPKKYERENDIDEFVAAVAQQLRCYGVTYEEDWLPRDLVQAADHRIIASCLSGDLLARVAEELTGTRPTIDLLDIQSAFATPRLLRLAVRPGQTADDYLRKLQALVTSELAAAQPSRTQKTGTVRDEPRLERLHGMDEAVAWGLALARDLRAYREGELDWPEVDCGLLLSGPPGCGKTLYARALAETCRVPLVSGSYSSWLATGTAHQGDLLKAMRTSFSEAKKQAPAILFLDEVDSFPDRARVSHRYREWEIQVVNALLAEMDGVEGRPGVVVVAACNHPDRLDPALVRSGRLDRHIRIGLPDRSALHRIFREHLRASLAGDNIDRVVSLAVGATGADVERFVRGALRRARTEQRSMRVADLEAELRGADPRPDDLELIATHEAGHVVAGVALGLGVDGVSLVAAGQSRGRTRIAAPPSHVTAADVFDRIVMAMAGRAAEEVLLGRVTSSAGGPRGSDLEHATILALRAFAELGLEEDHGLTWLQVPDSPADIPALLAADPRLATLVRERLASAYGTALNLVERHQEQVRAVAEALLRRRALDPQEVRRLVGGDRR